MPLATEINKREQAHSIANDVFAIMNEMDEYIEYVDMQIIKLIESNLKLNDGILIVRMT